MGIAEWLRVSRRRWLWLTVALGALIGGLVFAVPSIADDDTARSHTVHFDQQLTPDAATSIAQEYATSRANPDYHKAEKLAFVQRAAHDARHYYDVAALDALRLAPRSGSIQVVIVAPRSYRIDSVDVIATDEGDLTAQVYGSHLGAGPLAHPGNDRYAPAGNGDYLVEVQDADGQPIADVFSTWTKDRLTAESDPDKSYYAYRHKDSFHTRYALKDARVRAYPRVGSLTNWVDWAPSAGHHPYSCGAARDATAGFVAKNMGLTYTPCAGIAIAMKTARPGDMSAATSGDTGTGTELAFSFLVAADQASVTPMWNDYTKIHVRAAGRHWFCDPTTGTIC